MDFRVWALLSAGFAGITAVLAKKGVDGVPPNVALVVRVGFVLLFSISLALVTRQVSFGQLTKGNWAFLALSALATWLSWLCYFRALQGGPVSVVAPIDKLSFVLAVVFGVIFLSEKIDLKMGLGCLLIVAGVLLTLK